MRCAGEGWHLGNKKRKKEGGFGVCKKGASIRFGILGRVANRVKRNGLFLLVCLAEKQERRVRLSW